MEKDTYGSKIRNHLSPFCNIIQLLESIKHSNNKNITDEQVLEWIKNSSIVDDLWDANNKLIEISYDKLLDDTIFE